MVQFEPVMVIPTKGRKTLLNALESLRPMNQGGYGIRIIVVYDNHGPVPDDYLARDEVSILCSEEYVEFTYHDAGYNDWGYPQLEEIYKRSAISSEVMFWMNMGDDDQMIGGIIPKIVDIINRYGVQPYMFQAELYPSTHRGNEEPVILWNDEDRSITRKKVTGQNLIVPNIPHLMGNWIDDFEFIKGTIDKWHGLVKWIPIVTCRCY